MAIGCSRLGLRTRLVTHYAEDRHGQLIADHLDGNRVEAVVGGSLPTSTASATLDGRGAADYTFSLSWDITGASIQALAAVEGSLHIHTGSIAAVLAPGSASVKALTEAAHPYATISFDPNCRPDITPDTPATRQRIEDFVATSDIVKASDEDLQWLYPERTAEESLRAWCRLGPGIVVLTRGAQGPVVLSRSGQIDMPAEPIRLADTVGAGDSFMAALISGLAQLNALGAAARQQLYGITRDQLQALVSYANRAAGITCSRTGANPPWLHDLGHLPGAATYQGQ